MTATLGRVVRSRWSVRASVGAVLGGALEEGGRTFDIGPGAVASISASRQWAWGAWYAIGTLGAAVSRATTAEGDGARTALWGIDLVRAGAIAGRTFGPVSPYVLARAFGGPVLWALDGMDVRGTDAYHVQLGAGVSLTTRGGTSLLLDISALGERSASLGLSLRL